MASPALSCTPDTQHPAAAAPAACESCRQRPGLLSLRWPDTRFRLCQACVPLELTDAAEPYRDQVDEDQRSDPRGQHQPERPGAAAVLVPAASAAPSSHRGAPPAGAPAAASASGSNRDAGRHAGQRNPATAAATSAVDSAGERQVLLAAARTLLTSRPAPRGRRLGNDGSCDVVAALTLAAGGAVDETGRPAAPTERAPAKLLRRVLQRLADQLAGCAPGRSWNGDAVELIDAWQAGPITSGPCAAALLSALAQQSERADAADQDLEPAAAPLSPAAEAARRGPAEPATFGTPLRPSAPARAAAVGS